MNTVQFGPLVLSDEEAAELYRFTQYSYISPTTYPELSKLLTRITIRIKDKATCP